MSALRLKFLWDAEMKRTFDVIFSALLLILCLPVLVVFCFLIWKEDGHSPFYIARRVGINNIMFKMVKLRSMRVGSDLTGVDRHLRTMKGLLRPVHS